MGFNLGSKVEAMALLAHFDLGFLTYYLYCLNDNSMSDPTHYVVLAFEIILVTFIKFW